MLSIARVITYVAAALATFGLFIGMSGAEGAPQEAVVCAFVLVIAFIPYAVTATMQRTRLIALLERAERDR